MNYKKKIIDEKTKINIAIGQIGNRRSKKPRR